MLAERACLQADRPSPACCAPSGPGLRETGLQHGHLAEPKNPVRPTPPPIGALERPSALQRAVIKAQGTSGAPPTPRSPLAAAAPPPPQLPPVASRTRANMGQLASTEARLKEIDERLLPAARQRMRDLALAVKAEREAGEPPAPGSMQALFTAARRYALQLGDESHALTLRKSECRPASCSI